MACKGCDWCQQITVFRCRKILEKFKLPFVKKVFEKVEDLLYPVKTFVSGLRARNEAMRTDGLNAKGVYLIKPDEQLNILFYGKFPERMGMDQSLSSQSFNQNELEESSHNLKLDEPVECQKPPVAMDTDAVAWQLARQWTRNHARPLLKDDNARQQRNREKYTNSWIYQKITKREKLFPELN